MKTGTKDARTDREHFGRNYLKNGTYYVVKGKCRTCKKYRKVETCGDGEERCFDCKKN